MGKRYYCDYCDNTIPSNVVNRKKHNEGSYHQIMKNKYYSQFKGLNQWCHEFGKYSNYFTFIYYPDYLLENRY